MFLEAILRSAIEVSMFQSISGIEVNPYQSRSDGGGFM